MATTQFSDLDQDAFFSAIAERDAAAARGVCAVRLGDDAAVLAREDGALASAAACAANPVALLVPCHRVIPQRGGAGGYRWGAQRKRALLALERSA